MKKFVMGILAHVDAGKTTLTEGLLYQTGQIRSLGRVDHGDAFLDTDAMEKERGITIFSKQAKLKTEDAEIMILDTPGHVDFSAEMERTLSVLDCAVLVISGTDGIQSHTRTLWRLLTHYQVPTFLFINKMDLAGADREKVSARLAAEFSDGCLDLTQADAEEISLCDESLLNEYLENGSIAEESLAEAVARRKLFPCVYGSALHLDQVDALLSTLIRYQKEKRYPKDFGARVYKISRDASGMRLTHMKITGGVLHAKDAIAYGDSGGKADQIRIYSGEKYTLVQEVQAGEICAVTGLPDTVPGQGLGCEKQGVAPLLEPVLTYEILLPKEVSALGMYRRLKMLEEENPELHLVWQDDAKAIHIQLMGPVQTEILARMIRDRFDTEVTFGPGRIVYKETIARPVEAVGHFEPLRHYAEVHLLMEPGDPGSGIVTASTVSEDVMELRWQRLALSHVLECEHPGVLTGSALTDVKITLVAGRAHLKHTEGGDFRQAVYRAIRQGLMSTESVLLEPVFSFALKVPQESVGRALTDLTGMHARYQPPEFGEDAVSAFAEIKGTAALSAIGNYAEELRSYTGGNGTLALSFYGYAPCEQAEDVIAQIGYDPDADTEHPSSSVFCAHGAGFFVPWYEVPSYAHLPMMEDAPEESEDSGYGADGIAARRPETKSSDAEDAAFLEVYRREFGDPNEKRERETRRKWSRSRNSEVSSRTKYDKKGAPIYPKADTRTRFLIVDGYNVIFAWEELRDLAERNIDAARDALLEKLSSYQGYLNMQIAVVFDAYKRKPNPGWKCQYDNLEVIFTKEDETADAYIERRVHDEIGDKLITVATSDGLEQLTVMRLGALRMSARELEEDVARVSREGMARYQEKMKEAEKNGES
ncbi:MAG: TetM/TetW/TetO/TetS family tetracycline resistance ribosomal protection protein [Lachnospiraceae bacterium]|nr:TetM/TetW/TetO/TetS family tetracycline resistance ribosomal protection protein [Lachnospiraceae bacterium]